MVLVVSPYPDYTFVIPSLTLPKLSSLSETSVFCWDLDLYAVSYIHFLIILLIFLLFFPFRVMMPVKVSKTDIFLTFTSLVLEGSNLGCFKNH